MTLLCRLALLRVEPLLVARLQQLTVRIQADDETAWPELLQIVGILSALEPALTPERAGAMLTTEEMAARFGISPKTLLKRKCRGEIEPALQQGHLIQWSGRETLLSGGGWIACRKGGVPARTTRSTITTPARRVGGAGDTGMDVADTHAIRRTTDGR